MCFVHALLNALDLQENGYDVKLIIEGSATKQIKELPLADSPFSKMYEKVKSAGLIDCVCKACANQMGVLQEAEEQQLPICNEMSGHPSMSKYIEAGYEVITF
ncbi:MAG: DsrE family protein [Chloroflexi bacterium]|nr:DsrE family protein [Chloroflexota bacterium]